MKKKRPAALNELIARPQWVAYSRNKVPLSPHGGAAKSTDPSTWGTFEDAVVRQRADDLPGVGYVFSDDDGYVGIDLDDAFSSDGVLEPWAEKIVGNLASYTEISPSGRGLHIICRGDNVPGSRRAIGGGKVEVYSHARYFTVSGQHLHGTPERIEAGGESLSRLVGWMRGSDAPASVDVPKVTYESHDPHKWVADALDYIGEYDDYHTWIRVGMALTELGDEGFNLWCRWSSRSSKYEGVRACRKKWESFDGDGIGLGTVVWLAEKWGWEMPAEYRGGPKLDEEWVRDVQEMLQGDRPAPPAIQFYDLATAYEDDTPFAEDLIGPGVLGDGDMMLVAGPPKAMKSMLLLDMMRTLAMGKSWFDFVPARPLRVAMIQFEVKAEKMRERVQLANLTTGELDQLRGHFCYTDRISIVIDEHVAQALTEGISATLSGAPDVIVFDPLANIFDGDNENDNAQMARFLRNVRQLRNHINPSAAFVLVHHAGKSSRSERTEEPFNAIRGAGALRGSYDAGVYVEREKSTIKVWRELRNGPALPTLELAFVDGVFVDAGHTLHEEIFDALTAAGRMGNVYSLSGFCREYHGQFGVAKGTLQHACYDMLDSGELVLWQGGPQLHPQSKGWLVVPGMLVGDEVANA